MIGSLATYITKLGEKKKNMHICCEDSQLKVD